MRRSFYAFACALGVLALAPGSRAQDLAARITVPVNQARPLSLPAPAAGVAVGNPQVLAVSVQSDKLMFLTGRAVGVTNVVVVDSEGRTIIDQEVQVSSNEAGSVVLLRGAQSVRHECSPVCTPSLAAASPAPAQTASGSN